MNLRSHPFIALATAAALGGCAVIEVGGAVVGAAVSVTGAVVSTGVELTGKAVGAGIDALKDDDKPTAAKAAAPAAPAASSAPLPDVSASEPPPAVPSPVR